MAGVKGIWYVGFPTYQYKEDVQALAADAGLRILDARFDAGDGADDVPELTLIDDSKPIVEAEAESDDTGTDTETDDNADDALFDVFRIVDGEQNERASKGNLTQSEADEYIAERSDNEYVILPAE